MHSNDSHDGTKKGDLAQPGAGLPGQSGAAAGGRRQDIYDVLFGEQPSQVELRDGDFAPGEIVGGSYRVLEFLGRGAMGVVYRVSHISMQSEYALKVLTGEHLNDAAVMRFQNEAQAIAKLNHPNVIAIFNFGLHEQRLPFYVMDLLSGDNMLAKLDLYGPMPVDLALSYFIEVCAGLGYAHRKGILHRDVKPANFVLLDAPDVRGARVKVVDFGIVKFAEEVKPDVQQLTAIGEVCGSPSYMSPEQSSGQKIDPRADIYSLGCSLYQALTGRLPFLGRNATETMMMHYSEPVPTLASKGDGRVYSEDLESLVSKMLAKAPMDRYQNMDAVAQDLKNVLEGKPLGTLLFQPTPTSFPNAAFSLPRLVDPAAPSQSLSTGSQRPFQSSTRTSFTGGTGGAESAAGENVDSSDILEQPLFHSHEVAAAQAFAQRFNEKESAKKEYSLRKPRVAAVAIAALVVTGGALFLLCRNIAGPQAKKQVVQLAGGSGTAAETLNSPSALVPAAEKIDPISLESGELEMIAPVKFGPERYFSREFERNGQKWVHFDFPKGMYGFIAMDGIPAGGLAGPKEMKKGTKLTIMPAHRLDGSPEYFRKFRPGEVYEIVLTGDMADDQIFFAAMQTPEISSLNIVNCRALTPKVMPVLRRLNLVELYAGGLSLDGKELATLPYLRNLKKANFSTTSNLTLILEKMRGVKNLRCLDLSNNRLTGGDYQLVATMPNIEELSLQSSRVTAADFKTLGKLSNLKRLNLAYVKLQPGELLQGLKYLSHLRDITVLSGSLSDAELNGIREKYPALVIRGFSVQRFVQQLKENN